MTECVLDSSAVLAVLMKERGQEIVRPRLRGGLISAVNAGEILNKLIRNGESLERPVQLLRSLELQVIDYDFDQAVIAATFKPYSRTANLSLADRACLSLGLMRGLPVFTADDEWTKVEMGINIRIIRERRSDA